MNILIIGKGSNIGEHFIKKYSNKLKIVEFDVLNNDISLIDFSNVDTVIHLAAIVHQANSISWDDYYRVNTSLVKEIAIMSKKNGVKKYIFMSSIHVYGSENNLNLKKIPIRISTEPKPVSHYGRSKLLAEKELDAIGDSNFEVTIIRSPLVISDKIQGNLSNLRKMSKMSFLPIFCNYNKKSIISIDDLISLFYEVICSDSNTKMFIPHSKVLSTREITSSYLNDKMRFCTQIPVFLIKPLSKLSLKVTKLYGSLYYE